MQPHSLHISSILTIRNDLNTNVRFKSNPLVQMGPPVISYTLLKGLPGQGGHGKTLTGLGSRPTKGFCQSYAGFSVRGCRTKSLDR